MFQWEGGGCARALGMCLGLGDVLWGYGGKRKPPLAQISFFFFFTKIQTRKGGWVNIYSTSAPYKPLPQTVSGQPLGCGTL